MKSTEVEATRYGFKACCVLSQVSSVAVQLGENQDFAHSAQRSTEVGCPRSLRVMLQNSSSCTLLQFWYSRVLQYEASETDGIIRAQAQAARCGPTCRVWLGCC